jgi:Ca2+-binding EF-hand superfamily protein
MSRDISEVVQDLRTQLSRRGDASISTLGRAFKLNDVDRSGYFELEEFVTVLGRVGLFLKTQEINMLFRHFDTNRDKRINYEEFLKGLQGCMNQRRIEIVKKAFSKLDRDGSGLVDSKDIAGLYNASRHPLVLSGEKSEMQVLDEFLRAFEGAGGNNDGKVTIDEFVEYYSSISASIPYDDDYFVMVMERAWGIKEDDTSQGPLPPSLRAKLENVIREKLRQKTRTGKSEQATLQSCFAYFDSENSGFIVYESFVAALRRLGVVLDAPVSRALFDAFDQQPDGRISYLEFVQALYGQSGVNSSKRIESQTDDGKEFLEGSNIMVSSQSFQSSPPSTAKIVFLMGGPCSGKTSQAARMAMEFNFVHIDVAFLLQAEAQNGTSANSETLRGAISRGETVPPEVTVAFIKDAIEANVARGKVLFVLDGFPRSAENITTWQQACSDYDVACAIFLDAPADVLEVETEA